MNYKNEKISTKKQTKKKMNELIKLTKSDQNYEVKWKMCNLMKLVSIAKI